MGAINIEAIIKIIWMDVITQVEYTVGWEEDPGVGLGIEASKPQIRISQWFSDQ